VDGSISRTSAPAIDVDTRISKASARTSKRASVRAVVVDRRVSKPASARAAVNAGRVSTPKCGQQEGAVDLAGVRTASSRRPLPSLLTGDPPLQMCKPQCST
jgi:hypothetical protein